MATCLSVNDVKANYIKSAQGEIIWQILLTNYRVEKSKLNKYYHGHLKDHFTQITENIFST